MIRAGSDAVKLELFRKFLEFLTDKLWAVVDHESIRDAISGKMRL